MNDVHIFLLSVEMPDVSGDFKPQWVGAAALTWRHDGTPQPKKIGYAAECDLCHVLKDPLSLRLSPIIPNQAPQAFEGPFRIILTLQAKGIEADSNLLRVSVSWDGKWSDDREIRKNTLVVKTVE